MAERTQIARLRGTIDHQAKVIMALTENIQQLKNTLAQDRARQVLKMEYLEWCEEILDKVTPYTITRIDFKAMFAANHSVEEVADHILKETADAV